MDHRSLVAAASRIASIGCGAAALLVVANWAWVQPALADAMALRDPIFVALVFGVVGREPVALPAYQHLNLALIAICIAGASALALLVATKAQQGAATRRLAAGLALGAISAAYFFIVRTHPGYGIASFPIALRAGVHLGAYAAGFIAAIELTRFFQAYPRLPSVEERLAFHRELQEDRLARARKRWGARVKASRDYPEGSFARKWRAWLEREQSKAAVRMPFQHPSIYVAALAIAATSTWSDFRGGSGSGFDRLLASVTWGVDFMFLFMAAAQSFVALQFHYRKALPDERARIDWLYGTMLVAGLLVCLVTPAWWAALILVLPHVESAVPALSGVAVLFGPMVVDVELLVLACLVALALSIFYRGAVDPRLALRRVTLFTLVGIAVALAFLVLERAVAVRLVAWMRLPAESGAFIAGVMVAITLAPLRNTAERGASRLVSRVLPLGHLVEGPRHSRAVVLCDLSGYTRLSATDERQAMLLAALLQRLAETAVRENGGRVVKSMGDAVMLAFPQAAPAAEAILALHERFPPAAAALGLEGLPLHTGAHFGEVVETHDGDVYGQTVNIAARVQGGAETGQAVVSEAFATATGWPSQRFLSLGPRQFKNVPEPIACFSIVAALPNLAARSKATATA